MILRSWRSIYLWLLLLRVSKGVLGPSISVLEDRFIEVILESRKSVIKALELLIETRKGIVKTGELIIKSSKGVLSPSLRLLIDWLLRVVILES